MAPGPDGRVYVTNTGGGEVVVFKDGRVMARTGEYGAGPHQFERPHDVEVGGGRVYVADPGNDRIQVLDTDLRFVDTIGGPDYGFDEPKYMALDAAGRLLVVDQHNHRVEVLDAARRVIGTIGSGRQGGGADSLDRPEGATTWRHRIWISDTYNDRVVLYRRTAPK